MKRIYLLFSMLAITSLQFMFGQSPKRELRSTWLTTVWRLDWPSVTVPAATGSNDATRQAVILQQKTELIALLDALRSANMNAAFFQVRSMCDAMYASSYEPWSAFISSERGANPGYDPLAFAIEEAHKRGIELHAWLNPYRYSSSSSTHGQTSGDYFMTHPDWLLDYGNYVKILNPGLPEVVTRIKSIIGEIVNNYDVDGVVFDDYFYAYGGTSATLDASTQTLYKPAGKDVGDWRRENVNKMVAAVYDTIQKVKPYVTFGVSPFGTWTTNASVATARGISLPSGVGATGNMYAEIYCDPLAWLQEGKVDYVSPQLYWTTYSAYPYGRLAPWWSEISNRYGKHFYSSHSLSSMSSAPAASKVVSLQNEEIPVQSLSTIEQSAISRLKKVTGMRAPESVAFDATEIGLQIDFNRISDINNAPGSVFYAAEKTVGSTFVSYLKQNKFTQKSLCPAISWKRTDEQTLVDNITLTGQNLTWNYAGQNLTYAVYAVPNSNRNDADVFTSSKYLLGLSYSKQYTLPDNISASTHKIGVSVVDRYGNEFAVRVMGENTATLLATQLVYPANNANLLFPCTFTWNAVSGADSYIWQLARDAQFIDLVCMRETTDPSFFTGLQTNIQNDVNYFWRVKVRKANAVDVWSEIRTFSGHKFRINTPSNGASNLSVAPTLQWDNIDVAATYTLEISTNLNFNSFVIQQTLKNTAITLPENTLMPSTTYYARVQVVYGNVQATSETISFSTSDIEIPVPHIISPSNNATIQGTTVDVCWSAQVSKGFRAELSASSTFPARSTTVKSVDAGVYCASFTGLTANTYYLRVKANNSTGYTDASDVFQIVMTGNTAVNQIFNNEMSCYLSGFDGADVLNVHVNESTLSTVCIYSSSGLLLWKKKCELNNDENHILLSGLNLPKGIYVVEITSDNNRKIIKAIKN